MTNLHQTVDRVHIHTRLHSTRYTIMLCQQLLRIVSDIQTVYLNWSQRRGHQRCTHAATCGNDLHVSSRRAIALRERPHETQLVALFVAPPCRHHWQFGFGPAGILFYPTSWLMSRVAHEPSRHTQLASRH